MPVNSAGNVYVVDVHNNRIQKFDSNGNFIPMEGSYGTWTDYMVEGEFNGPMDVTVDLAGNVYVVDTRNNRI